MELELRRHSGNSSQEDRPLSDYFPDQGSRFLQDKGHTRGGLQTWRSSREHRELHE